MATTAVALAGGLAAAPAWAADKMSVGVSGYMEQWVGVSSVDGLPATDNMERDGGSGVHSDSEVHFKGKLEADNGLEFGVTVELEGNENGKEDGVIDESFAWVGGSFGELQIGAHDDAASLMHYGNQDVGIGINAADVKVWIPVNAQFNTNGWHGDRKGIIYYTPRIGGVQFGASYAPDVNNAEAGKVAHNNDTDAMSVGLNVKQTLGDASVAMSAGHYVQAQTGDMVDDMTFTNFGLRIGMGGIGFDAAYAEKDDGTEANSGGFEEVSAGVVYADGPMAVSLSHFQTDYEGSADASTTMLSLRYTLAPGVESRSSIFTAEDSMGVEGSAFVTGLKIGF